MPRRKRYLATDAIVVIAVLMLALPPWASFFSDKVDLAHMHSGSSWQHLLGTDNLGRDLLVRLSQSLAQAVLPLWSSVIVASTAGLFMAQVALATATSRYSRYIFNTFGILAVAAASVPMTVTTFAWAAWFEEAGLYSVILALSAIFTARAYLHTRDLARQSTNLAFWSAHEALGGRTGDRVWRYGISSAWTPELLLALGLNLRVAVAVEASLSYLGFGIQEPTASFGNILAAHFDEYLKGQWTVMAMTLAALALTAAAPPAFIRLFMDSGLLQVITRRLAKVDGLHFSALKQRLRVHTSQQ